MTWLIGSIAGLASLVFLLWLEIRSERRDTEADHDDFKAHREFHIASTSDWQWPPKTAAPRAEYVAKRREWSR